MNTPLDIRKRFLNRWANIPVQFRNWTFDDCKDAHPDVLSDVKHYAEEFPHYAKQGVGLLLIGSPGRGKTSLGCAVLNHVMSNYDIGVRFTTLQQYIRDLQELIKLDKQDEPDKMREWEVLKAVEKIMSYPLVQLDDVGKEYRAASGYAVEQFDHLIRQRHSSQRPTILTTNLPLSRWDVNYDPSMKSYIQEACVPIVVEGDDIRKKLT